MQLVEDEVAVLEHLTVVLPALVATTSTVSPEPTPWVSIVGVESDVFASVSYTHLTLPTNRDV